MSEEKLSFAVTLSGTFWDKRPQFSIWLDDHQVIHSEIASQGQQEVKFERTLEEGPHSLKIRLENKTNHDTVIEHGEIVKDMLLNINGIAIDDIDLGNLLWTGEYLLDKPQQYQNKTITHLDHCVNLGWNGTYILHFSSPLHKWLLSKL